MSELPLQFADYGKVSSLVTAFLLGHGRLLSPRVSTTLPSGVPYVSLSTPSHYREGRKFDVAIASCWVLSNDVIYLYSK
jgi:hypothetical protein